MNIYSDELKKIAKLGDNLLQLEHYDLKHMASNPICGDRVTIDLLACTHEEGEAPQSLSLGFKVRGCLISKASTALVQQYCNNRTEAEIQRYINALQHILEPEADPASSVQQFSDLEALLPLAAHKHRHSCALLPIKALTEALDIKS